MYSSPWVFLLSHISQSSEYVTFTVQNIPMVGEKQIIIHRIFLCQIINSAHLSLLFERPHVSDMWALCPNNILIWGAGICKYAKLLSISRSVCTSQLISSLEKIIMTTLCKSFLKTCCAGIFLFICLKIRSEAVRQAFVAMWGLKSSRQKGCRFIVFVTVAGHFCKAEFFKSMTFISWVSGWYTQ